MKRRNFLKALPAADLTLAGCGQNKTAPANTASLVFDHSYPLDYAKMCIRDSPWAGLSRPRSCGRAWR